MNNLNQVWSEFMKLPFPEISTEIDEFNLMLEDTNAAGCITYFLKHKTLDKNRIEILSKSRNNISKVIPKLKDSDKNYFKELLEIINMVLERF